jgi:outer membrane protein insertion porin family
MKVIYTLNQPIPRLTTINVAAICMTLGLATSSWGQIATTETTDSFPRETQSLVNQNFSPAIFGQGIAAPASAPVSSEIFSLTAPGSSANCNAPRENAVEIDFLQQLNCVFLSSTDFSQAALLEGLQVEYKSESRPVILGAWAEVKPAEILAQDSYYQEEEPQVLLTPMAGVGGRKGIYGGLNLQVFNLGSNNGIIDVGLEGGEKTVGASLSYTDPWFNASEFGLEYDFGYQVKVFNSRNPEDNFLNGDPEVNLIHDHIPWVDRLGGGVEFFQPLTSDGLILSLGANYQRVAIRNAGLTDKVFSRDRLGNRVTVSNQGIDNLLTVGAGLFQDGRNDPNWPTEGYRFQLSGEQSIPLGDSEISMTRVVGSYSQFIPIGSSTIAFGVQGGNIFGDAPPYQAFEIGGGDSVRGYGGAELGSGRRFITTAVEYRFLIADDLEWPFVSRLGGTFFFDYGTDFGSGDDVIGESAEVRGKPGNGFGGGVGVRLLTTFGQVRGEVGMNDDGDFSFHIQLGDRF